MSKANAATIPAFDPVERLEYLRQQAEEGHLVSPDPLSLARLGALHAYAGEARLHQQSERPMVLGSTGGGEPVAGGGPDGESEYSSEAESGLFDAEGDLGGSIESRSPHHDRTRMAPPPPQTPPLAGVVEQPGRVVETSFALRVREACSDSRPRYWFLINTLEGNDGAAESWGDGVESEIVLRRWSWLQGAWSTFQRAAHDPDLIPDPESFGRLLGQRGDEFAAWIECETSELVDLLEKAA